jgi:hypothetical protein
MEADSSNAPNTIVKQADARSIRNAQSYAKSGTASSLKTSLSHPKSPMMGYRPQVPGPEG